MSQRNALGVCELCGATEGQEHGMPCAALPEIQKLKTEVDALLRKPALGGKKDDGAKPDLSLFSTHWLFGVGQVLTFGKKKYAAHNWRQGIQISRLMAACLRHILAFNGGEDLDPETGLSHLHHASCCLMFASELLETKRTAVDDRYKEEPKNDRA